MSYKYLSYMCIAGAIILFSYTQLISKNNRRMERINKITTDDKINYRLQSVDRKRQLQELQMKSLSDEEGVIGTLQESLRDHRVKVPSGIDSRTEMSLENIYKHLNDGKRNPSYNHLDDEVNQRLQEIQDEEEYMEAYRKAYIDAFLRNARKNGVRIKIDDDLNVYTDDR